MADARRAWLALQRDLGGDEVIFDRPFVPTLDDAPVRLRIPAGTPNGRTFRVKGRGAKTRSGSGDLMATIEVQVPTHLSEQAQEALQAYVASAAEPDPRASLFGGS